MPDEYDGIILGTGHNSLVLQAYMARSGLLPWNELRLRAAAWPLLRTHACQVSGTIPTRSFIEP
jgi:hypothetical protein